MLFASATNFQRKSGEAKRRDLRFYGPIVEMFFDGAKASDLQISSPPTNLSWNQPSWGEPSPMLFPSRRKYAALWESLFEKKLIFFDTKHPEMHPIVMSYFDHLKKAGKKQTQCA